MNFDIQDKLVGICAKRQSGKSELTKYIISQYGQDFSKIIVISGTEHINGFYKKVKGVDPKFIYEKYDESFINNLMKKMGVLNKDKTKKDNDFKHILLILDDVCSSFNTHASESLKKLATTGRHFGIAMIIIQQYLYQIPPIVRSNCDWVLVSQMNTQSLDILASEYRYGNIETKEFKQMYLKNTSNYGFLLINANCSESNDDLEGIYGNIKVPAEFIASN